MTVASTPAPLTLDWLLPEFDATIVEHRIVDGYPEAVCPSRASGSRSPTTRPASSPSA